MGSGDSSQKKANLRIQDSFLEALRELSLGSGKSGEGTPMPKDIFGDSSSRVSGQLVPGQTEAIRAADLETRRYKRLFFQERSLRHEEKKLRVKDEQEAKLKIEAIRQDLRKLATAQVRLEEQVQIAVFQTEVVSPGVYHVSFFEQLRQFIASLRKDVESAASWMAVFNQKNKKKGYYWGHVKKKGGGSNFYLSGERYMATQAG